MCIPNSISKLYCCHVKLMNSLQSVFLLIIRLYWGYRFFRTGWGKLHNIPDITEFFTSLGITFPHINAYMAATTECVGGMCLLLGLAGRIATVPLVFTMIIAYITADSEAVKNIFSDPDKFIHAEPFMFMMTSLIVLLFGPGKISVDYVLGKFIKKT